MNVKISYTVPMERVPSKVDELLAESGQQLSILGEGLKQVNFDESDPVIIAKLEKIDKVRKQLMSIDLLLEDCYTILASYNKALADMKMLPNAKQETLNDEMAEQGRSGVHPTESSSNSV